MALLFIVIGFLVGSVCGQVDGGWSDFRYCTEHCGGGFRMRKCNNPTPSGGGDPCAGANTNTDICNTHPCDCKIDLCYVLDGSGSIEPTSWTQLKQFAEELTPLINVGNGSYAGVVQFSDAPAGEIRYETDAYGIPRLSPFYNTIIQAIQGMDQYEGRTAIGEGLKYGQAALVGWGRWFFTPDIPKVILLITDGDSNEGEEPVPVSVRLKANGTEIFVIGVDGPFIEEIMIEIASEPKQGTHYFYISSYAALLGVTKEIAYALCYSRGRAAPATLYLLLLLLLPFAAGVGLCFFVWRRRSRKPAPVVEEPPPPVKAAAPAPKADKPKDWTVPGTRYIGFGQANIKVKWGTDAPPSAPRGHDKYDRWSMQAHPAGLPPAAMSPSTAGGGEAPQAVGQPSVDNSNCCRRFFPCFFPRAGAQFNDNVTQMSKTNGTEAAAAADDGNWEGNTAVPKS